MKLKRLTSQQKERLKILEPKLKNAIRKRDFNAAESLIVDIQNLLLPTNHIVRLVQSKNAFYELALELNKLDVAIKGFTSNRTVVKNTTRLYLEATTLLAISYLRSEELEKAKPLIKEVLLNDSVIKTERTRRKFRAEVIERFNEETALYSLKNKVSENFSEEELEKEIVTLLKANISENELYQSLGFSVPEHTRHLLFEVHEFSRKQLPSAEKLSLPSPEEKVQDKEVGKTIFKSTKRVIYRSLCDHESDIYRIWFKDGLPSVVLNKGYIRTAVLTSLADIGIGGKMIIAYVVALILRFGLEFFCLHYEPTDLMDLRKS